MAEYGEVVVKTKKTIVLTDERLRAAQMLADGLLRKEIAKRLKKSVRTVEWDFNIMRKLLNAQTLPALVAKLFRRGLIK